MAPPQQRDLFDATLPQGMVYREGFVDADEEAALLQEIGSLPLAPARVVNSETSAPLRA